LMERAKYAVGSVQGTASGLYDQANQNEYVAKGLAAVGLGGTAVAEEEEVDDAGTATARHVPGVAAGPNKYISPAERAFREGVSGETDSVPVPEGNKYENDSTLDESAHPIQTTTTSLPSPAAQATSPASALGEQAGPHSIGSVGVPEGNKYGNDSALDTSSNPIQTTTTSLPSPGVTSPSTILGEQVSSEQDLSSSFDRDAPDVSGSNQDRTILPASTDRDLPAVPTKDEPAVPPIDAQTEGGGEGWQSGLTGLSPAEAKLVMEGQHAPAAIDAHPNPSALDNYGENATTNTSGNGTSPTSPSHKRGSGFLKKVFGRSSK